METKTSVGGRVLMFFRNIIFCIVSDVIAILTLPLLPLATFFGIIGFVLDAFAECLFKFMAVLTLLFIPYGIAEFLEVFTLTHDLLEALKYGGAYAIGMFFIMAIFVGFSGQLNKLLMGVGTIFSTIYDWYIARVDDAMETGDSLIARGLMRKNTFFRILLLPRTLVKCIGCTLSVIFLVGSLIFRYVGFAASFYFVVKWTMETNDIWASLGNEVWTTMIFARGLILVFAAGAGAVTYGAINSIFEMGDMLNSAYADQGGFYMRISMWKRNVTEKRDEKRRQKQDPNKFDKKSNNPDFYEIYEQYTEAEKRIKKLFPKVKAMSAKEQPIELISAVNKINAASHAMYDALEKLHKKETNKQKQIFITARKDFYEAYEKIVGLLTAFEEKMKNPCYSTEYFNYCKNLDEVKKHYKELCKILHPDSGGDSSDFIKMQEEYNSLIKSLAA